MNWHACGKCFATEKMALNLKMAFNFYQENLLTNDKTFFTYDLKMLPIILLRLDDWLGKKGHCFDGAVGKMAVKDFTVEKGQNVLGVAALDNFS